MVQKSAYASSTPHSMKITILSPHIDDAAYCLALTISRCVNSKIPVTVINCFTVTNWTIVFVSRDIDEVSLLRKKEDVNFYNGYPAPVNIVNLELTDAPLRNGYIWQFQPLQPDEQEIVGDLKNFLEKNVDSILLCPLGIGNHVDHAICREAVLQLYDKATVLFFEDLPYAYRISEAGIVAHIKSLEERLQVQLVNHVDGLQNCTINKEQAIRLYKSQLNDEICSEIIGHMNALSGERLWGEAQVMQEFNRSFICS